MRVEKYIDTGRGGLARVAGRRLPPGLCYRACMDTVKISEKCFKIFV